MLGDLNDKDFEANPSHWIGTEIPALLTNDGLKLETGELITEGKSIKYSQRSFKIIGYR